MKLAVFKSEEVERNGILVIRPWALRCGSPPLRMLRTLTFLFGVSRGIENVASARSVDEKQRVAKGCDCERPYYS